MVMKELLRCDEETQKTFLKEVMSCSRPALPHVQSSALCRPVIYSTAERAPRVSTVISLFSLPRAEFYPRLCWFGDFMFIFSSGHILPLAD